jgi:hypothetical protein
MGIFVLLATMVLIAGDIFTLSARKGSAGRFLLWAVIGKRLRRTPEQVRMWAWLRARVALPLSPRL